MPTLLKNKLNPSLLLPLTYGDQDCDGILSGAALHHVVSSTDVVASVVESQAA